MRAKAPSPGRQATATVPSSGLVVEGFTQRVEGDGGRLVDGQHPQARASNGALVIGDDLDVVAPRRIGVCGIPQSPADTECGAHPESCQAAHGPQPMPAGARGAWRTTGAGCVLAGRSAVGGRGEHAFDRGHQVIELGLKIVLRAGQVVDRRL